MRMDHKTNVTIASHNFANTGSNISHSKYLRCYHFLGITSFKISIKRCLTNLNSCNL